MKISEALQLAIQQLQQADVDSPALDAKILLEAASGKTRAQLIAHDDAELSGAQAEHFDHLLQQRLQRRPIAQILGCKEFYGRDFFVDENVLTPRPETEQIIDAAKNIFSAEEPLKIVDLGTGSGCILLTLLQEFPNSEGVGIDKSKKAIAIAQKNKYNLGVDRAKFICSDWLKSIKTGAFFDLVVSNPPYISKLGRKNLAKELDFEPNAALVSGVDGLECYRAIAESINKISFKFLILEIGIGQEAEIINIFNQHEVTFVNHYKDLGGIIRILVFKNTITKT